MRRRTVTIAAIGVAAAFVVSGCGSSGGGGGGNTTAANTAANAPANTGSASTPATTNTGAESSSSSGALDGHGAKVGIILPDTKSSQRWVTSDPDALKADCKKNNLDCTIQNAQGSKTQMKTIAESMESAGVKVLMIVNLDNASGAAIEKEAASKGITTVDYDRYTEGGKAALYVSFDGVAVGKAQGNALMQCPQVKGKSAVNYVDINGSHTDSNAAAFKQGYDSVLSKATGWKKLDDQWTADWDNPTAGKTFASMLTAHPNINAVMVANDGMANAVISVLKQNHLNGKIAVSGQDATAQGLQHILDGDQCFTIYKPSAKEAAPAIDAITQIVNGQVPKTNSTVTDTVTGAKVPAILAAPIAVNIDNVALPINDGYTPKNQVCTGSYAALCTKHGVK
jgi:D-xylose transport system substrate-binding protein